MIVDNIFEQLLELIMLLLKKEYGNLQKSLHSKINTVSINSSSKSSEI